MLDVEEMRKDLEVRGHRIVENTMSDAELDKLEKDLGNGDADSGYVVVSEGPWEATVAKVRAMRAAKRMSKASRVVTIRIPARVVDGYKAKAAAEGVGYQTLMNEVLEAALA